MQTKRFSAILAALALMGTTMTAFAAETTINDTGRNDVSIKIISPNTNTTKTKATPTPKPVLTTPKDKGEKLPAGIFTDTKDHWAKGDIQAMTNAGYVSGYSDGTFKPNEPITRVQVAAILNKVMSTTDSESEQKTLAQNASAVTVNDVASDNWANQAVKTVVGEGIMSAPNGKFNPNKNVTREDFASAAARFATHQHITNTNADAKVSFKDSDKINPSLRRYVDQLAQEGFIASGVGVQFRPKDTITRAEATSILYRMVTNNPIDVSKGAISTKPKTGKETAANASMATDSQIALEDKVFTALNKTYKTPSDFQKYGVMYWRNDELHVAIKNPKDINTVKENLAALGDETVNQKVVVEPTRYSQAEYDVIDKNFRTAYAASEPKATIFATFPDVANNRLYAVVSDISKATQASISKAFGDKVAMAIK